MSHKYHYRMLGEEQIYGSMRDLLLSCGHISICYVDIINMEDGGTIEHTASMEQIIDVHLQVCDNIIKIAEIFDFHTVYITGFIYRYINQQNDCNRAEMLYIEPKLVLKEILGMYPEEKVLSKLFGPESKGEYITL